MGPQSCGLRALKNGGGGVVTEPINTKLVCQASDLTLIVPVQCL